VAVARTLLLVRHAKAVADGVTDAERELAPRGFRDARAAGRWLVEHQLIPDHVLVSPARRARQTWETMLAELGTAPAVTIDARIYDNTVESLLEVIHEAFDDNELLALVGHNPSIHGLALALDDGHGDPGARSDLADGFPTSGIAVFNVAVSWAELAPGEATLRDLAVPRG
jgi:phosphohistidine phosphatase